MNVALKLALGTTSPELMSEDLKTKEIVLERTKLSIKKEAATTDNN